MILNPEEIAEAENQLIAGGVNPEPLMDEAGLGIAKAVSQFFPNPGTLIVFIGSGHNGGDALVAAKHLKKNGWITQLRLVTSPDQLKPLTAKKLHQFERGKINPTSEIYEPQHHPLILLDGLLGIGAVGGLRPGYLEAANEMNELRKTHAAHTFAIDIPSGLDGLSGEPYEGAVIADFTLTIAHPKTGLLADQAINNVGRLALIELPSICPLPGQGDTRAMLITASSLAGRNSRQEHDAHKGTCGRIGIIGGNNGMNGAAVLASTGAARGGAGLVTIIAREDSYQRLAAMAPPEIMVRCVKSYAQVSDMDFDTLAIGPGLGQGSWDDEILDLLVSDIRPTVVDADALNLLARNEPSDLVNAPAPRLLTPHPGEMHRLCPEISGTRRERAEKLAGMTGSTVLLKGARTVVASESETTPTGFNSTGNNGMATGGVGDTLTGLCSALIGSGVSVYDAACVGSWINGRAAEHAIFNDKESRRSLLASDLPKHYGQAFKDLERYSF
ncbi:MAG TPA: NAD(P)H-hydrate dehydratase [Verrucomicrobia bacterium]|nr:NAD(P)H-hydrate dehydratase [Verrucomicrobiota bacterium]